MSEIKTIRLTLFLFVISALYSLVPIRSIEASTSAVNVNLSTNVQEYITLSISAGSTAVLPAISPGAPVCSNPGTVADVDTNASNGYTLGVSDGSDTDSALRHTDETTYIADYAGTIAEPTSWSGNGLGITMYQADSNPEVKWGTGSSVCDDNSKYAGIPALTNSVHTVTGFRSVTDTSSYGFKLDVPNTQKTGDYSGLVTFTATAVLI